MVSTQRSIVLLRGINVGGHKKIKMAELRSMFEELGFQNVKTALATGNIGFDTDSTDMAELGTQIHNEILRVFGHDVSVLMRTQANIQALVDADPFEAIEVTPDTRLYVSFLSEKPNHNLKIPYEAPTQDFTIIRVSDEEVCSVLVLSEKSRSVDSMAILEKEFGKGITTRNWNTMLKIANL